MGEKRRDAAASAADGTRPAEALYLIRCGGRHTYYSKPPPYDGPSHRVAIGGLCGRAGRVPVLANGRRSL
jgi:hypothetical protein